MIPGRNASGWRKASDAGAVRCPIPASLGDVPAASWTHGQHDHRGNRPGAVGRSARERGNSTTAATGSPRSSTRVVWQLRCCLADSQVGDRIAVIVWSPFRWDGPFRETGPIWCTSTVARAHGSSLPFPSSSTIVRWCCGPTALITRSPTTSSAAWMRGTGMADALGALLHEPRVEVHGRNPLAGCFVFAARRGG